MSDSREADVRTSVGRSGAAEAQGSEAVRLPGSPAEQEPNGGRAPYQSRTATVDRQVRPRPSGETPSGLPAFKKGIAREYFESAVVTFVMALFGMTFIVQAVKVPTGSMKNTIYIGDHLLVNKFLYGSSDGIKFPIIPARDIHRGDVIVFKYPRDPEVNYVKRVIGLPGDTVEFNSSTHRVYVNGQELPENLVRVEAQMPDDPQPLVKVSDEGSPPGAWYTVYYQRDIDMGGEPPKYAVDQPYRVPKKGDPLPNDLMEWKSLYDQNKDGVFDCDQYFCMGDNRDNSEDSRYWGPVPRNAVVGRALFVYWSIGPGDPNRSPLIDFFSRTRWWRTGKFIK
ncbi:MAG TPA: signal peptidase I [Blastocatellia bacterium]